MRACSAWRFSVTSLVLMTAFTWFGSVTEPFADLAEAAVTTTGDVYPSGGGVNADLWWVRKELYVGKGYGTGTTDLAGYCEVDRGRDMLDAPKTSVIPNGDVPQRSFSVDVRGLPISRRGFLQNLHVESLLGHHLLQPSILILQRLELLGHFRLHASDLLSPAVIRLLGDLKLFADRQRTLHPNCQTCQPDALAQVVARHAGQQANRVGITLSVARGLCVDEKQCASRAEALPVNHRRTLRKSGQVANVPKL